MADETQIVQQVVARFQQAFADQDVAIAASCLGPTYLFSERRPGSEPNDPNRWSPGYFSTLKQERETLATVFAQRELAYANRWQYLSTQIEGSSAVVVTQETGKEGGRIWNGVTNLWYLAKLEGSWKIVGSIHKVGEED